MILFLPKHLNTVSNFRIQFTQVQRLYFLIYDDNVSDTDICQHAADPRADWPVESSSGLFNIASVCLRNDPSQRPDMEEVGVTYVRTSQKTMVYFLSPGCHAVGTISAELTCIYTYIFKWFIFYYT